MDITLAHRAYEELRGMVARGQLQPGARLVNRSLAKTLNVSQTPIREAISRLVTEGVAELVPGAGAFVRRVELHDLTHLYELREMLEPYAAGLAARNAADFEVHELRRVCEDWLRLAREIRDTPTRTATDAIMARWNDNEEQYHTLIISASRNRWLQSIAGNLRLLTAAFTPQRQDPALLSLAGAAATWREHTRIVRAIRARDSHRASDLMRSHIAVGKMNVLRRLQKAGSVRQQPRPTAHPTPPL